jgi:hypothetical protein
MNAGTRQVLEIAEQTHKKINSTSDRWANMATGENAERVNSGAIPGRRPRVFVAAENRLLREALSRMLIKSGEIEVVEMDVGEPFQMEDFLKEEAEILLLSSRGNRNEDLGRGSQGTDYSSASADSSDWRDRSGRRVSTVRAGGNSRVPSERRFGGGRGGRRARAAGWRSNLSRHAVRHAVSIFGTRSDFLSFGGRTPAAGIDAAGTAIDPTDCRRAHEQGNRQPLLSLRNLFRPVLTCFWSRPNIHRRKRLPGQ